MGGKPQISPAFRADESRLVARAPDLFFNGVCMAAVIVNRALYDRALADCLASAGQGDLHVFGYGSLMWRPGFRPSEMRAARVRGYARRLAVRSTHYRGTPARPGLVFGLDAGGSCNGVALRVPAAQKDRVIRSLFRREMFAHAYHPRFVRAELESGGTVRALAFIVRRDSPQYAPPLPPRRAAGIVKEAAGFGGGNAEYVKNAFAELSRRGVSCPQLAAFCALLD